ncbi:MAG: hypothetical protein OQK04_06810 [Kangiellaceae bacterium]|nr:hypothetical protein [Kangiellaceae bacterium]
MAKQCIACKREISKGQQECPLCGAPQSYLKFYLKTISIVLIIAATIIFFGLNFHSKSKQNLATEIKQRFEAQLKANSGQIEDLKSKLHTTEAQLSEAAQAIEKTQSQQSANASQTNQMVEQL